MTNKELNSSQYDGSRALVQEKHLLLHISTLLRLLALAFVLLF